MQFRDGRGLSIQKGTGTSDRLEAYRIASDWQQNGIPQGRSHSRRPIEAIFSSNSILEAIQEAQLTDDDANKIIDLLTKKGLVNVKVLKNAPGDVALVSFLDDFWDFDHSQYIREKQAHGQSVSRRHCYDSTNRVKYWKEAFPNTMLSELTKQEIRSFTLSLKDKGLSASTINKIMLVCSTAVGWAKVAGIISDNPFEGAMRFTERHHKRGILTEEETKKLFSEGNWTDQRCRVASLLSCTTGLREGECRAVQIRDIIPGSFRTRGAEKPGEANDTWDQLNVWGWSDQDRRKRPKNGENRIVNLLPEVFDELQSLIKENPYGQKPETYVFFSAFEDKPIRAEPLIHGLDSALVSIGISKEIRQERSIDFHSWRHYFSTMISPYVASQKIRIVTGHKSPSVFQGYTDHARAADIQEVGLAAQKAFGTIVEDDAIQEAKAIS